ncbi:uncharacterized protein BDW47DRAFT_132673 [Aspergillus candidus]|uniref:DUF7730 domain-containing protein n=1 Tax=Aspergillus candidus TaxID=41067 RepID=A0A2I2F7S3_ASPCN|nr:hypothetical protein BDW47DRAFT_132673 [Aspergillus candidus]PLB36677.1 hypothetical protein BDW47DRAFT_132673 [Aspergillus candidus]
MQFEPETQTNTPSSSGFQRLPAELRLKIYAHLFTTYRIEIVRKKDKRTEGTKKPRYRLYNKRLRPREDKSQGNTERPGRWWLKRLPMALIFTCRSIYSDTILLLYANTQFVFTTTNAIARFIKITPADAQASIRHVELRHIMYNEPRLTEFRIYKARSDMAFYLACEDMALAFKSLRVLHVDMRIYDWPIRLEIGELWSLPLLFFGGEGGTGIKLDEANIRLRMVMFSDETLRRVARDLEQRMMGPVKFQVREDERLARELHMLGRKAKVLRLVM